MGNLLKSNGVAYGYHVQIIDIDGKQYTAKWRNGEVVSFSSREEAEAYIEAKQESGFDVDMMPVLLKHH